MRLRKTLSLAVLLGVLAGLLSVGQVSAHANLVRSDPSPNSAVPAAPGRIQTWYSEEMEPAYSDLVIYDSSRQRVDNGDKQVGADRLAMSIGLKPGLPNGTYTVAWRTLSAVDGHAINGAFAFTVGPADQASAGPVVVVGPDNGTQPTPLDVAVRWLNLLAASALVGGLIYLAWIWQPAWRQVAPQATPRLADRLRLLALRRRTYLWAAWGLLLFAHVDAAVVQAARASGVSFVQALGNPFWQLLTNSRFGTVWLIRLALILALAVLLFWLFGGPGRRVAPRLAARPGPGAMAATAPQATVSATLPASKLWLGLALGAGVLLTASLNSHSAALQDGALLATAADWLHFVAVAVWIGGLFALVTSLTIIFPALEGRDRTHLLGVVIGRFSAFAAASVALVSLTGVYIAVVQIGDWGLLFSTGYGQTLLVKLALVAVLLLLGLVNLTLVGPRARFLARQTEGRATAESDRLRGTFHKVLIGEAILGVAILGVVGVLSNQPPAREARSAAQPANNRLTLSQVADDLQLTLTIEPNRVGNNRFDLAVVDAQQQPVLEATKAALRFTYQDLDLGTNELALTGAGDGHYRGEGAYLSQPGNWQADIIVRRQGRDDARTAVRFVVPDAVARPAASTPVAPPAAARRRNPIVADSTSLARGKELYQQNCAQCHGDSGHGDGPAAAQLNPKPVDLTQHVGLHSDGALEFWITNGIAGSAMPSFRERLGEEDRWHVVNYIRTFAPVTQ